jgi:hypothetical protein
MVTPPPPMLLTSLIVLNGWPDGIPGFLKIWIRTRNFEKFVGAGIWLEIIYYF